MQRAELDKTIRRAQARADSLEGAVRDAEEAAKAALSAAEEHAQYRGRPSIAARVGERLLTRLKSVANPKGVTLEQLSETWSVQARSSKKSGFMDKDEFFRYSSWLYLARTQPDAFLDPH